MLKANKTVLELEITIKQKMKITCTSDKIQKYYLVIVRFIANYKEKVAIIIIKLSMYYLIYIVLTSKHKNLYKD